ncbi:MAG: O-antigen ligase family protein [Candidatus Scalinduaceae bacterium]
MIKSVDFNNNVIWVGIVLFIAVITGIAIANESWLYLGIALSPLIIYLCIEKPFIFPLGLYVFLIPFDTVLLTNISYITSMTKLLGIITIVVLFLKGAFENKLIKPDATSFWWMLFIMYVVLSAWWAIETERVLTKLTTVAGLLLLYLIVSSYKTQKYEYEILKWCILVGGLLVSIFSIYNYEIGNFRNEDITRSTLSVGENYTNPNRVAFSYLIPFAICLEMLLNQKKKIMKALFGSVLCLILFAIVISGSRGCMLSISVIIIVYILSIKQRITFCTILIIIGILLMSYVPDFVIERWGKALDDGGSGRLDIWYVGCKAIEKYWLIGAGYGNYPNAYDEFINYAPNFKGYHRPSHNTYLGIFVELGVIGFTLMLLAIMKHYRVIQSRFNQYNLDIVMLKASFWAILVSCLFTDSVGKKAFWVLWMMIMMYKNISEDVIVHRKALR